MCSRMLGGDRQMRMKIILPDAYTPQGRGVSGLDCLGADAKACVLRVRGGEREYLEIAAEALACSPRERG